MPDLETELRAAASKVRQPHIDRVTALAGAGWTEISIKYPPFGVERITIRKPQMWEPAGQEDGADALIVPVCWPIYREGLCGPFTMWEPIDLIALNTARPDRWQWRTGTAWALGGHLLEDWQGEPVHVVATPMDWLRAGGDAVCPLDWSASSPVWPLLRMISAVEVDDQVLGRRVMATIERTAPHPILKRRQQPDMEVASAA